MADRSPLFVDTAYIHAVLNLRDQWHDIAVQWEGRLAATRHRLVTTKLEFVEVGNSLAKVRMRSQAARVIDVLRSNARIEVIPLSPELFAAGFDLYRNRPDKDWGLTDCCSFVAMRERGLAAALTTDEHFRQAGFQALLLEEATT